MLKADEYYIKCKVVVLAKVTGHTLPFDGDIVRLYYTRMLKIKDYGIFEPEGWEYEIDESSFYDLDNDKNYEIEKMKIVEAYHSDKECTIPRDLKILEVYKTHVISMDTEYRKEL